LRWRKIANAESIMPRLRPAQADVVERTESILSSVIIRPSSEQSAKQ
jgi:hypothetical protein